MQCGRRDKEHLVDPGWLYGELRQEAHRYSRRGHIVKGSARVLKKYKRWFSRRLRRIGKAHCDLETAEIKRKQK